MSVVKYWFTWSFIQIIQTTGSVRYEKAFFSVRVIDTWNSLPEELLQCRTADNFKIKLDFSE